MAKRKGDELLTPDQVAERLHCTKRYVLRLAREGKLTRVKLSSKIVLFEEAAVEDLIRRRRQNGHNGRQRPLFDDVSAGIPARF